MNKSVSENNKWMNTRAPKGFGKSRTNTGIVAYENCWENPNHAPLVKKGVDTTKKVTILKSNITSMFLEFMRYQIQESEHWSWKYPLNSHFSKRHPKLTMIDGSPQPAKVERLAGLSMALFTLLYEQGLSKLVYPDILWAGASIKDKHRKDNIHTDHEDDIPKDWKVIKGTWLS